MSEALQAGLRKAGVSEATRHLFLCLGPDCCKSREGEKTWEAVKTMTAGLPMRVMRTKAACFRICAGGPILAVYPDGIWYGKVTPERFAGILQKHLVEGQPVREWIIAENPLLPLPCVESRAATPGRRD